MLKIQTHPPTLALWLGCRWQPPFFSSLSSSLFLVFQFSFLALSQFSLSLIGLKFSFELVSNLGFMTLPRCSSQHLRHFSLVFTTFCYLVFHPLSHMVVPYQIQTSISLHLLFMTHPHPILCFDLWALNRKWMPDLFPSLTFPPRPACQNPLKAKCYAALAKVR